VERVQVFQVGIGTVGGAVLEQIVAHRRAWERCLGVQVVVGGVAGREGALLGEDTTGISEEDLLALVRAKKTGESLGALSRSLIDSQTAIERLTKRGPLIVMDAAAGDDSAALDAKALELGGGVVLSNKAPMALEAVDDRSRALWAETGPHGRVRYEATCGAGLPVISTLRNLLDTGDEVVEITGTVSGTFGAIFSDVAAGKAFSVAVRDAKIHGYTEPDPRDDLSGLDVARKALILARSIGRSVDLDRIEVESLVPEHLREVGVDEFLGRVSEADQDIAAQAEKARSAGETLKYVATIEADGPIEVGIKSIPRSTVLGALQGPENIVSIRTKRYDVYPLTVTGPGAGAAVTAAGMTGDMLALADQIARA
jgi:homoserine dehydrogenase